MLRKLIVTFLGHVDHGKTSLQDYIRASTVAEREAGAITQHVGASSIPVETFRRVCGDLLSMAKMELKFDGLLCIDTPGHAAFSALRRRGGNLADLAVLVVDINEGLQPQTLEAIDILRNYKTPFVVALNKIDLINGWKMQKGVPLLKNVSMQRPETQTLFEMRMYDVIGKLYEIGLEADRFDRVSDFTKQVAVVPTSARSGEGMPELLMVLAGLTQRYLESRLSSTDVAHDGHGTILEIKEMQGVGKVMDIILYDGHMAVGNTMVVGGVDGPLVTKVRSIFEPNPLQDLRDKKSKYQSLEEVHAACGVRVSAPDIEDVMPGMPIISTARGVEEAKKTVQAEVKEVVIETDHKGIVIKADTLGSLEALVKLLQERSIPIRHATVGPISKKDLMDAQANFEHDPLTCAILGFSVDILPDAKEYHRETVVQVFTNSVIYRLIEEYELWKETEKKKKEMASLSSLPVLCKLAMLKQYVFRQSGPFVCGVEVLLGTAKSGMKLMNQHGRDVGVLKSMQEEKENVSSADRGMQVAGSFPSLVYKRSVDDDDMFYTSVSETEFRKFKTHKGLLSSDTKEILKEIAEIKRREEELWGV